MKAIYNPWMGKEHKFENLKCDVCGRVGSVVIIPRNPPLQVCKTCLDKAIRTLNRIMLEALDETTM